MNLISRAFRGAACLLAALLLVNGVFAQTTWYVDDDAPGDPAPGDPAVGDPAENGAADHPFDAVQEAIDASADGDTVLVAAGRYVGRGNYDLIIEGKSLTIQGPDDPATCVIDCEYTGSGIEITGCPYRSIDVLFSGLTLTGQEYRPSEYAAIRCGNADLTLIRCVLANNHNTVLYGDDSDLIMEHCRLADNLAAEATAGLCLWSSRQTVILSDCVIESNHGGEFGAGAFGSDAFLMERCTIADNHPGDLYSYVSGIAINGEAVIIADCVFDGNADSVVCGALSVERGIYDIRDTVFVANETTSPSAALDVWDAICNLTNCRFEGNRSSGAVCNVASSAITAQNLSLSFNQCGAAGFCMIESDISLVNCMINDNVGATEGGGLRCYFSNLDATGCLIVGNLASQRGGGIVVDGSAARFANCLIANNSAAESGGGVHSIGAGFLDFTNTILWGNEASQGAQIAAFAYDTDRIAVSFSHSLIDSSTEAIELGNGAEISWGTGNLDLDPQFVDPASGDYRLLDDSPCIDAGCNCAVSNDVLDVDEDDDVAEFLPFDLAGKGRFFDTPDVSDTGSGLPPIVDIGPYEFGGDDPSPCRGDLNGDRVVSVSDLGILLAHYHQSDPSGQNGDLNCDGRVELTDLAALLSRYGKSCN